MGGAVREHGAEGWDGVAQIEEGGHSDVRRKGEKRKRAKERWMKKLDELLLHGAELPVWAEEGSDEAEEEDDRDDDAVLWKGADDGDGNQEQGEIESDEEFVMGGEVDNI
ncbi:hypothetical protein B0H14DRAFT_2635372 [Mycena olivaceomarginata]|nr:hypothetical protein B0H14DRAFT_2635372 [Mycena olivaceomarginata]